MLNHIHPSGLSKDSDVKVYSHPGATSDDIKHHINPSINRKPDVLIVHVGTRACGPRRPAGCQVTEMKFLTDPSLTTMRRHVQGAGMSK